MATAARKSLYSIHPSFKMVEASIRNQGADGQTVEEWSEKWLKVAYELDES
jgi:hypothetical protein